MESGRLFGQIPEVKLLPTKCLLCLASVALLNGCANYHASGGAPGSVSGTARSESRVERSKQQSREGEFYNTETLTPGVGSALFPDPAWR
jgi:hypothetical protein